MNILHALLIGGATSAITYFALNKKKIDSSYPRIQNANKELLNKFADYSYNMKGVLIEQKQNNLGRDRFIVRIPKPLEIYLKDCNTISYSCEIGCLARILATESLTYNIGDKYYNISMFTRICLAETIKNRINSNFGFYKNYNSYKKVIENTGYAIYGDIYKDINQWLKGFVAKKRFIEEVLPIAIFSYFNNTDNVSGYTGFVTPSKLEKDKYKEFINSGKYKLLKIKNIDAHYEFTFWKYKNE